MGLSTRIVRRVGLVVAAAAVLSACSAATSREADGEPALSAPLPADVDLRTLTLPLDAFIFSADQNRLLDKAVSVLAVQCLARFGFRVAVPDLPEPWRKGHDGQFGLTDLSAAQQFGYHPDPAQILARRREPELPPEAFAVMQGEVTFSGGQDVPVGGCLGEARRKIGWVDQKLSARAIALANDATTRAKRDRRVVAAFERWSGCMRAKGYEYRDPWQANDDRRWQESPAAGVAEVQVATADVVCKVETNLISTWVQVEAAYQLRAVENNMAALAELKTKLAEALRNAADVLTAVR